MKIAVLTAAVSAYIEKTSCADILGGADQASGYVAAQLENVSRYFIDHSDSNEFYSTSNFQVFHKIQDAVSHSKALDNKVVLKIERADIAALIAPPEVETGKMIDHVATAEDVVENPELKEGETIQIPVQEPEAVIVGASDADKKALTEKAKKAAAKKISKK